MDYKFKKENYEFWVERLKKNKKTQVCTNDVGLDELESKQILSRLKDNKSILEIGCGNGLLYQKIHKLFDVKDAKVLRRELKESSFKRQFELGEELDGSSISAKFEDGILSIEIPKIEPKQPKTNKVKIS